MSMLSDVPMQSGRIPSESIARVIDEILALDAEGSPSNVYRVLALRLGVHSTTLLRYHQGRLHSAPPVVLREAKRLLAEVRKRGALPPVDRCLAARQQLRPRPARVPSWKLADQLDALIEMLELTEPSALHRLLAMETGIHATTVLRFHRGVLVSAPQPLLDAAMAVEKRVRAGESIRFPHGSEGEFAVTRRAFAATVDLLMETRLFAGRNPLLHRIEDELDIPRGKLTRLYRCRTFRWVPHPVQAMLEALYQRCQYDPGHAYDVGDRFHHHVFGAGRVEEKLPLKKISVRFDDGSRRILRECLREDRYWRQPSHCPSPGESYSMGSVAR